MAIVKPKNLKVNYKEAWEELENHLELIDTYVSHSTLLSYMEELKKKHKNMITLEKRTDKEMVDYCINKSVEAQMENIHLKKKLKEYRKDTKIEHWIQVNSDVKVKKRKESLSQSMKFLNEIEEVLYKKNTSYDQGIKYINFSDIDRYILDRILELKILTPNKIRVRKPERKLFDVHLVCITKDNLEFTFDWHCTDSKAACIVARHS